jgi:phosphoribosylformylglycinamidine synthase I
MTPRALVMSGYGLNCEEETAFALERGGCDASIVHINDLIDGLVSLDDFQAMVFPGGFSYGDDTGSGNAFANKLRNHLWDDLVRFVERDTLTLGICNGFQILANLGLIVPPGKTYGERTIALLPNVSGRYAARWVDLELLNQETPFFRGIDRISLPIAHGEGRLFATERDLDLFWEHRQVGAQYVAGEICDHLQLSADPNGSTERIAAMIGANGRIMGMMPHPERAIDATQLPHWRVLREKGDPDVLDRPGPGLQIFQNIAAYFA